MGTPTSKGAGVEAVLGCPGSGHRCPGGVEPVLGLHHVSSDGNQRKFLSGGASI